MAETDAWADTADDIRRAREAEARDTRDAVRDTLAERVAELEAQVDVLAASLEWALGQAAGRGGLAHPTSPHARAGAAARAALAKARARSQAGGPDHA